MGEKILIKKLKPIIDEIVGAASPLENRVLAKHYGFTEEELNDLINYDIKYRMGRAIAKVKSKKAKVKSEEKRKK